MSSARLVAIFQALIVASFAGALVLVIAIDIRQFPNHQEGGIAGVSLPSVVLLILVGVLARFGNVFGNVRFFVKPDADGKLVGGSFVSIFITFLIFYGATVGIVICAVALGIPVGLICFLMGGLGGGLLGSWASASWEIETLFAGLGAFCGLSADAGISYAGGALPKSVLGAFALFILNVSKEFAEALQKTQLPTPSQTAMSLFLWPLAVCALLGLLIGAYKKRAELKKLKVNVLVQGHRADKAEKELEDLREKLRAKNIIL